MTLRDMINRMHSSCLQDEEAALSWFKDSSQESILRVWQAIQIPYPNDPFQELITRFAQLAFSQTYLKHLGQEKPIL